MADGDSFVLLDPSALVEAIEGPRLSIPLTAVRRLGGDLAAAAFLCQAAFLSSLARDKEGWFDLLQVGDPDPTADHIFGQMGSWEAVLGIGQEAQVVIRKKLKAAGLLEEKKAGVPGRLHYRVQADVYLSFLAGKPVNTPESGKTGIKNPEKPEPRIQENRNQESGKTGGYSRDRTVDRTASFSRKGAAAAKKTPPSILHGVTCWTPRDRAQIQALVEEHGPTAVEQAAAEIKTTGDEALPSYVQSLLQRNQHHAEKQPQPDTSDLLAAARAALGFCEPSPAAEPLDGEFSRA